MVKILTFKQDDLMRRIAELEPWKRPLPAIAACQRMAPQYDDWARTVDEPRSACEACSDLWRYVASDTLATGTLPSLDRIDAQENYDALPAAMLAEEFIYCLEFAGPSLKSTEPHWTVDALERAHSAVFFATETGSLRYDSRARRIVQVANPEFMGDAHPWVQRELEAQRRDIEEVSAATNIDEVLESMRRRSVASPMLTYDEWVTLT